jgi:hypothetical protein
MPSNAVPIIQQISNAAVVVIVCAVNVIAIQETIPKREFMVNFASATISRAIVTIRNCALDQIMVNVNVANVNVTKDGKALHASAVVQLIRAKHQMVKFARDMDRAFADAASARLRKM